MYKNEIIGKMGEDLAQQYIQELGMKIIKRNFYCKFGEIDIIAKDQNELVFIEVKTRTNNKYGKPVDAVNFTKQKHLYYSIEYYLYSQKIKNTKIRIDVIEIYINSGKESINHIKNIYK